jgi:hypothetical protein
MEVKIVISDSAGGGSGASVHVHAPGGAALQTTAAATAPSDLQSRAAAIGAIDAGSAPDLGSLNLSGAPIAYVSSGAPGVASSGPGESAGAAPGSGAYMETSTAPAGGAQ